MPKTKQEDDQEKKTVNTGDVHSDKLFKGAGELDWEQIVKKVREHEESKK